MLILTIDLFLVKIFSPNAALSTGEFSAILLVGGLITTVGYSICFFFAPSISTLIKQDHELMQKAITDVIRTLFIVSTILCLFVTVFSGKIFRLFGESYFNHTIEISFYILIGAYFIQVLTHPMRLLGLYSGHEKSVLYIHIFGLFVLIGFGIPLTMKFGVPGICCAIFVESVVVLIGLFYVVKKNLGYRPLGLI
jgi:O-antigen/teichoic acid export membrane protein